MRTFGLLSAVVLLFATFDSPRTMAAPPASRRLRGRVALIALATTVLLPAPARADVLYFYDDVGRLTIVADTSTGEGATYAYDAVGNVLAISRFALVQEAPRLDTILPAEAQAGTTVGVTLRGANLRLTRSVTTDNRGIAVNNVSATAEEVTTVFSIASGASAGAATVTVTNPFGSATIGFTILPNPVGRVVVNSDEWTLSDGGFSNAPDAARFALNVAAFLAGSPPARVHAYSNNFGFTGARLGSTLTAAGYAYTTGTAFPFTLENIS